MLIHPQNLKFVGLVLRDYKSIDNSDLIEHIRINGQLSPVFVFEHDGHYYYDTGVRRIMACKELGINVECELIPLDENEKKRRIDPKRWGQRQNYVASNL